MRTVSRCNPNSRAASRILIPSTITARRTRRYTSTLYIRCTTRRLDFEPMDGGGRSSLQPPFVSDYPPTWPNTSPPLTLLRGGETVVWCDAGYQGVHKREENLGRQVDWQVAMRPGRRRRLEPGSDEALAERYKASVRAKVEHSVLRVKRLFGYCKVPYRGLAKNSERLALLLGLGNLMTAEGRLAA